MARYIHLADDRGRDAEIIFSGRAKKASCKQVTRTGEEVKKIRVLKGTAGTSFDAISRANNGDANAISKAIMDHDPDIDLYVCGQVISGTTRVYIGQDLKPVSSISRKERVYAPDGALIEERIPKEVLANIMLENPIRPGKLFPKKDIYNKLVFAKKYQIFHIN
jgi:hypothetical protein